MSGGKFLTFAIGFMMSNEKARGKIIAIAKKSSAHIDNFVNDKFFKKEKEDDRRNNGGCGSNTNDNKEQHTSNVECPNND